MLELPAGGQDHRIVGVRLLAGRLRRRRHQLAAAVGGREPLAEHDLLARRIGRRAGIGHGAFPFQPLPRDIVERRHGPRHLGVDIGRALVGPVEAHSPGDFPDDPDVVPRLAGQGERLPAHLDLPVGVGDRAGLLRPGRGRQYDIGMPGRLGQEQVLHHQMIEFGEGGAGVGGVRVGHRRILAHDVHAVDFAGEDRVDDFNHRQAALRIQRTAPKVLDRRAQVGVFDRLVVRQEHRDQPGVRRALDIVLPAQRMQAGARPADLAGDQRERDQATGVVGAVDVLGNSHAPEDDRAFRPGEFAGDRAQFPGADAADRRHLLRRKGPDMLGEGREALDCRLDILLVVELLLDDRVEQRVQQRDIRAALELQHVAGVARQRLAARIGDDQGRAARRRLLEIGRRNRVVLRRVGADHEDDVAVPAGGERRGDGAGADAFEQRRDRRGVAQPGAMIDIVRAEAGAHQLLEQVGLLVGALGRAEAGERVRSLVVADAAQAARGALQCLLPARFPEIFERVRRVHDDVGRFRRIVAPDQRSGQPLRAVGVVEAEAALDAQPLFVGRAVPPVDIEQLAVLQIVGDLAADAAIGADALDPVVRKFGAHAGRVQQVGRHQGAGRAGLHALAAGDAGAGAHRIVHVEHDLRAVAALGHADHIVHLDFAAGPNAQGAVYAGVQMHRHRRVAYVRRRGRARRQAAFLQAGPVGPLPEAAFGIVRLRLCRLVRQQHLENHRARRFCPL